MKVLVLGVATEIGKTWASSHILEKLRSEGIDVVARKPVQSFDAADIGRTDADVLAAASGETPHEVCPPHRWYPLPMAPPMAAEQLGREPVTATELLAELTWPGSPHVMIVETVGGVRSPLAVDADSAEFAQLADPDRTLLVADAGLGTINAVRLAIHVLHGLKPLVFLNHYDDGDELHRRNRRWLTERDTMNTATDIGAVCTWIIGASGYSGSGPLTT